MWCTTVTITHDQDGNLTGDGTDSFAYDPGNRLISAAMGAGTNVAYLYDPMGRRAGKTVDGVVTDYLHDGTHVIAEYDGAGAVLRRYVHGPVTDRPIAMVEGSAGSYIRSYYHADHLGSVVALTDDSGAPVAHYTYDAYGIPYLVDPGTGAQTQVAAGQPYLFTGRRFDFETGLYYYRARYYSASLGRFLQTDPIGYDDQMNLYAYVGNDPVNGIDPLGLAGCDDMKKQGLSGYCMDAINFNKKTAPKDKTVVSTKEIDAIAPDSLKEAGTYVDDEGKTQKSPTEETVRFDQEKKGNATSTELDEVNKTAFRAENKPEDLEGAEAYGHTHPQGQKEYIGKLREYRFTSEVPGGGDDAIVRDYNLPNYVQYGNTTAVIEISEGQFRVRVVKGNMNSKSKSMTRELLKRYQSRIQ